MAELIDLTLTLGSDRVSNVPGLMGVETSPLQTHETHARSNQKLCLATHISTHVDAPFHFVPGAATIEEMPLEKYTGPALLLDLRNVARGQEPLQVRSCKRREAPATQSPARSWCYSPAGPRPSQAVRDSTGMGRISVPKEHLTWPPMGPTQSRWTSPSTSIRPRPNRPSTTSRCTACCWAGTSRS